MQAMMLTAVMDHGYAIRSVPHWTGGLCKPYFRGAEASRRQVRGFFYAHTSVMAGGVLGGRKACRAPRPGLQTRYIIRRPGLCNSGRWFKTAVVESSMKTQAQVAPSALKISDISVRQDSEGRYCLNDLHKAAGGNPKHQPYNWLRNQQTKDLIDEFEIGGITPIDEVEIPHIRGISQKKGVGTFAVKELVYAYAMWISASFSLKVIRAYDALQGQSSSNPCQLPKSNPIESFRTKILVCIDKGEQSQQVVPFGSCIVDPENPVSVATFIREFVPSTPQMLSAISSAYITKLMDCQDAAINHLTPKEHRRE